ncbi:DUF1534 domain-containing protein [Pseudomonas syringae UB303]|uniref:DUF1534 domain-containing protein n=1 Tax=Pseudomonas syringae UB303 TaxID=1357287 RepID=A0AAJ4B2N0_PSESX|nr:DUF1534 domain-containing protein [Pseudomonas syringae UB303]
MGDAPRHRSAPRRRVRRGRGASHDSQACCSGNER